MGRFTLVFILPFVFASLACSGSPRLAGGPIDLSPSPTLVAFVDTVHATEPLWELCFEFDLPGDSHHAGRIEAVLVDTQDQRYTLSEKDLDRRGESVVCQVGRIVALSGRETGTAHTVVLKAVELTSEIPLRVHGLRGGSRS